MPALRNACRRFLARTYLAASSELTRRLLGGQTGMREFQRVIIVARLDCNDDIAQGARLQFSTLLRLGVEVELLDATPALRNPLFRIPHRGGTAYIFHSRGPQTASLIGSVLPSAAKAYRIAYWASELPDPPSRWAGCDRSVSEIWTPSDFSRNSLSKLTRRPIAVVPHHVLAQPPRSRCANQPFTVLAMADSRSSLSRKNPEGAVRAFHAAFGTSPDARLILKLGGSDDIGQALERSAGNMLASDNVEIVRGGLDEAAMTSLYRRSDVLLSMHRAEGFGLPMLEAMAHGVPVVATGWSGNLQFMTEADSILLPCKLVSMAPSASYGASVWAEPDQQAAAQALRQLAQSPDRYATLAAAAHRRVQDMTPQFPLTLA